MKKRWLLSKTWGCGLQTTKKKRKLCRQSRNPKLRRLNKLSLKCSKINSVYSIICSTCHSKICTKSRLFKWKSRWRGRKLRRRGRGKYMRRRCLFSSRLKKSLSLLRRQSSRWCKWRCLKWSWSKSCKRLKQSKSKRLWSWRRQFKWRVEWERKVFKWIKTRRWTEVLSHKVRKHE